MGKQKPNQQRKEVTIYTDGACVKNPGGAGGWGAILIYQNYYKEISGGCESTTNNRMEITGVIEAMKRLKFPCDVTVISDSKYVVNAFEMGWLQKWKNNLWRKPNGVPVPNKDLWLELLKISKKHNVKYQWVKGHANNKFNNRCDELAEAQARLHITVNSAK